MGILSPNRTVGRVLSPRLRPLTKSVKHGQCDTTPTVTILASEHYRGFKLVPNYTAWWQRQVCMSGLPSAVLNSAEGETRTRDLSITSPTVVWTMRLRARFKSRSFAAMTKTQFIFLRETQQTVRGAAAEAAGTTVSGASSTEWPFFGLGATCGFGAVWGLAATGGGGCEAAAGPGFYACNSTHFWPSYYLCNVANICGKNVIRT